MLSYKQYVNEKRRNPEQNPKIPLIDKLVKYSNMDDVYVSFRSVNKLGINPKSDYNTPNGIYCYSLESYKDDIDARKDSRDAVKKIFPFLGFIPKDEERQKELGADKNVVSKKEGQYAIFFTPKNNNNVIKLGDITEVEVIEFIKNALEMFNHIKQRFIVNPEVIKKLEVLANIVKKAITHYDIKDIKDMTSVTNDFRYDISDAMDEIKSGEKTQVIEDYAYDISRIFRELYEMVHGIPEDEEDIKEKLESLRDSLIELKREIQYDMPNYGDTHEYAKWIYENELDEAKVKSVGGKLWFFTYRLYGNSPNKWNAFFRKMGIVGIDDNNGEGIIHENEPFQSVFFDKTDLKVLESAFNKAYDSRTPKNI